MPSAMWKEHSSGMPIVNALGVSTSRRGLLAAFFKDMINRDTMTGINLTRTKSFSRESLIVRAGSVSHSEPPVSGNE